jgi:methionine aminopeptidase
VILPGDLVKLDLTAEKDGYYTDFAVSIEVLSPSPHGEAREMFRSIERLDLPHRGRQPLRALRAHHCDHARGSVPAHGCLNDTS